MPRLSIVIPCWGDAQDFEDSLVSVLQNRPDDCEVLVVLRQPYDDPYDLSGEVRFIEADRGVGLVELINGGIRAATGDIVGILGCHLEVSEGWSTHLWAHFQSADVAAVIPLIVAADGQGTCGVRWTVGGRRVICRATARRPAVVRGVRGPLLWGGFFRRHVLLGLGGFAAEVGESHADADLAATLHALSYRVAYEPASCLRGPAARLAGGAGPFRRSQGAERTFWRHVGHLGWTQSLLRHMLVLLAGLPVLAVRGGLVRAALGRLATILEFNQHARYRAMLNEQMAEQRTIVAFPSPSRPSIRPEARRAA